MAAWERQKHHLIDHRGQLFLVSLASKLDRFYSHKDPREKKMALTKRHMPLYTIVSQALAEMFVSSRGWRAISPEQE